MFFTYVLASAWAMSAVVGRSSDLTSRQMTYEKEDKTIMKSHETSQVMAIGDRSSNLKYVMAIQSSTIWEEIKKRSLKVNGLDGKATEKSPETLTDEELAQLKQACHDGLKCVAIDQLLVLKQVKEPLTDGKVSVRQVITKITQVLTQYTTEYHEDVYQYETVQQSDDQSKVYEMVTTIVEDNKELCQIDLKPTTKQSHPKNVDLNNIPEVVNNNSTVNYNTTKNYNINNGTVNSATINIEPHSGDSVVGDRSKDETPSVNRNAHGATNNSPTGGESITNEAKNNAHSKHFRPLDHAQGSRTVHQPIKTTDDQTKNTPQTTHYYSKPIGQPMVIIPEPSPENSDITGNGSAAKINTHNSGHEREHRNLSQPAIENRTADGVNNNTVELDNSLGYKVGGENYSGSDIVSAGSQNKHSTRKGFTEDGYLNNGNMKVKNVDNSNRNKGTIKGAKANNGIINVGTTNNGPVNYGTSKNYTNNGNILDMDSHDIGQYVNDIDKMYSIILKEFSKI